MKRNCRTSLSVFAFIICCTPAYANGATPLMLAVAFHLSIANFVIGILEGEYISKTQPGTSKIWAMVCMVFANYVSMAVGVLLIEYLAPILWRDWSIQYAMYPIVYMVLATYIATLIVEWPFVWLILMGVQNRLKLSIRLNFIVQTISYAALFILYYFSSTYELNIQIDQSVLERAPMPGWVYFLDSDNVKRIRLDGSSVEEVMMGSNFSDEHKLLLKHELKHDVLVYKSNELRKIALSEKQQEEWRYDDLGFRAEIRRAPYLDFQGEGDNRWNAQNGLWRGFGLSAVNENMGMSISLIAHTPFSAGSVNRIHLLPNGYCLFQFNTEICLLELETEKLALLTRGSWPVFIPDE